MVMEGAACACVRKGGRVSESVGAHGEGCVKPPKRSLALHPLSLTQLLVLRSPVSYGRRPHTCAALLTRNVLCQPSTIGTASVHVTAGRPPR